MTQDLGRWRQTANNR